MKFLYSDSLDFVDPEYDFVHDRHGAIRRMHADDDYPHEHFAQAPYDGLLISRAIVGDVYGHGKYTPAQAMRFHREGARAFLRYPKSRFRGSIVMGDCGAFSYRNAKYPPYSVEDTLEFYEDAGFSHGCSVDHVIFDFTHAKKPSPSARQRFEITLDNAARFIRHSRTLGRGFTPVGVIQGWSPASMAEASAQLAKMGYRYLAVGGMVPLRTSQICEALSSIREVLPSSVKLHLLGFGKIEDLAEIARYGIASFDTTSPLRRAFKDAKKNYFALRADGDIDYYTAIRIPQAVDNPKLMRRAKRGRLNQERLLKLEADALDAVRAFGKRRVKSVDAVRAVMAYGRYALWDERLHDERNATRLDAFAKAYVRTLEARAWESCTCRVCIETGVETLIFRSSNRNKRRGFHNLHVFYASLGTRFGRRA
jgi:hypothetical protein